MWFASEATEWAQQCSKHLSHIEKRLMTSEFLGHEVVRIVYQVLEEFKPQPVGDWGYMMRKITDISVQTMRQLMTIYGKTELSEVFHLRAMSLVRLYIEEAFHRLLEGIGKEEKLRKMGLCSLMVTMKKVEARTLGEDHPLGVFATFSEDNVRKLAIAIEKGDSGLEDCPSWNEVSLHADLKFEAFSLKRVRVDANDVLMTKSEVAAVIEGAGGKLWEGCELPGHEGPSLFSF